MRKGVAAVGVVLAAALAVSIVGIISEKRADDEETKRRRQEAYNDCVSGAMEWRHAFQAPEAPPSDAQWFPSGDAQRRAQAKYQRLMRDYEAKRRQYESDEKSFIAHVCPIIRGGGEYPQNTPFPAETSVHMVARDNITADAPLRSAYIEREKAKAKSDDQPAVGIAAWSRSITLSRARALDACTQREIAKEMGLKSLEDVPLDAHKIGYMNGLVGMAIDTPAISSFAKACRNEQYYIDAKRELDREYPDYSRD